MVRAAAFLVLTMLWGVGAAGLLAIGTTAFVLRGIYVTALYRFATLGDVYDYYRPEMLEQAFRSRQEGAVSFTRSRPAAAGRRRA